MTTRSVRRRLDLERPVEPEVIEDCIRVAVQAPTGLDRESWRFLVVTEPERRRALGALYLRAFEGVVDELQRAGGGDAARLERPGYRILAERLHELPVLILVCAVGEPDPDSLAQQVGFYGSVLPAAWSLMLALRARGLGATWTTLHLREADAAAGLLGIPAGVTQTVLLPVAYTKDARLAPAQRRGPEDVAYWNAWGRGR